MGSSPSTGITEGSLAGSLAAPSSCWGKEKGSSSTLVTAKCFLVARMASTLAQSAPTFARGAWPRAMAADAVGPIAVRQGSSPPSAAAQALKRPRPWLWRCGRRASRFLTFGWSM